MNTVEKLHKYLNGSVIRCIRKRYPDACFHTIKDFNSEMFPDVPNYGVFIITDTLDLWDCDETVAPAIDEGLLKAMAEKLTEKSGLVFKPVWQFIQYPTWQEGFYPGFCVEFRPSQLGSGFKSDSKNEKEMT